MLRWSLGVIQDVVEEQKTGGGATEALDREQVGILFIFEFSD